MPNTNEGEVKHMLSANSVAFFLKIRRNLEHALEAMEPLTHNPEHDRFTLPEIADCLERADIGCNSAAKRIRIARRDNTTFHVCD